MGKHEIIKFHVSMPMRALDSITVTSLYTLYICRSVIVNIIITSSVSSRWLHYYYRHRVLNLKTYGSTYISRRYSVIDIFAYNTCSLISTAVIEMTYESVRRVI